MTVTVRPPVPPRASGAYQAVNETLWLDRAATVRRASQRAEQRAALAAVDGILSDLERLRLAGHDTLPPDVRRRVERTLIGLQRAGTPMGRRRPPVRGTIRRLTNRLFALEAEMLRPTRPPAGPAPVLPEP